VTRLAELARSRAPARDEAPAADERCDLCNARLEAEHRHVVDLHLRSLLCACRGCAILLGRPGAGGEHFRLVPERRLRLEDFRLDEAQWSALRIPVDVAFFFHSRSVDRVVAVYPGAMGATESQLEFATWHDLERENPALRGLESDVEALLVNRIGGSREHYLVPIDDCYALAGVVRTHWRGLAGGTELWRELDGFFDRLRAQAVPTEEEAWQT